jgi:hypothetical protein
MPAPRQPLQAAGRERIRHPSQSAAGAANYALQVETSVERVPDSTFRSSDALLQLGALQWVEKRGEPRDATPTKGPQLAGRAWGLRCTQTGAPARHWRASRGQGK